MDEPGPSRVCLRSHMPRWPHAQLRPRAAWALALALGALGCGGGDRLSLGQASELAEPRLAELTRFDGWARRVASSDTAWARGDRLAALEETAFAPVRRDDAILAAWISRTGVGDATLAHPPGAVIPEDVRFTRVRVEPVGELDVALTDASLAPRREGVPALLIRRSAPGTHGSVLVVTVAFRRAVEAPGAH